MLVVDPFVSCHELPENDNSGMDRVVKAWARVAKEAGCGIVLVHHTRKMGGDREQADAESSRGGKAFVDGCRAVRVLNRMTAAEAQTAGVENHRRYFREVRPHVLARRDRARAPERVTVRSAGATWQSVCDTEGSYRQVKFDESIGSGDLFSRAKILP